MDFEIPCECGRTMVVSEGAAGSRLTCGSCGGTVVVPSWGELRELAGLDAVPEDVAGVVRGLVEDDVLPGPNCSVCGVSGGQLVPFVAECERQRDKRGDSRATWSLSLLVLLAPIHVPLSLLRGLRSDEPDDERTFHGRDTVVHVPMRLCLTCRADHLSRNRGMRLLVATTLFAIAAAAAMTFERHVLGWSLVAATVVCVLFLSGSESRRGRFFGRLLRRVPEYERLLDRYPDADVQLVD